ncbi:MAG: preprotein translocase subunit SecG [Fulvivirga sp.]
MLTVILSLIVLVAVLLVLVILAQNSKGGGLSSQFGGSGASNMIGVKKTGDLLSNLTWGLIIVLFALTISTNFITIERAQATDEFIDRAQEESTVPSLDLGDVESSEESTPVDQNDGLQNLESEEDSE